MIGSWLGNWGWVITLAGLSLIYGIIKYFKEDKEKRSEWLLVISSAIIIVGFCGQYFNKEAKNEGNTNVTEPEKEPKTTLVSDPAPELFLCYGNGIRVIKLSKHNIEFNVNFCNRKAQSKK